MIWFSIKSYMYLKDVSTFSFTVNLLSNENCVIYIPCKTFRVAGAFD